MCKSVGGCEPHQTTSRKTVKFCISSGEYFGEVHIDNGQFVTVGESEEGMSGFIVGLRQFGARRWEFQHSRKSVETS